MTPEREQAIRAWAELRVPDPWHAHPMVVELLEEMEQARLREVALEVRVERLEREMRESAMELQCECDPAWTDRVLHETDCRQYIADGLLAALEDTPKRSLLEWEGKAPGLKEEET